VTLGVSTTEKKFFESTTSETLSLPNDADEKSFLSVYENGLLKVTVNKK
jgi:HSP20 family molecular chaperone IbpA